MMHGALQERARIARELHDSVSQTLYAIALGASRAHCLLQLQQNDQAQHILENLLELASTGQSELRALLEDIRSDGLTSGGLTAALSSLAADVVTRDGLDVRVSDSTEQDLPAATIGALVAIAREALHNVVKHAAATRADIVIERSRGLLVMLISDDGVGFEVAASRPGHFGLLSMRERAAGIRGTLELLSVIGRGTQIRVSIPCTWTHG